MLTRVFQTCRLLITNHLTRKPPKSKWDILRNKSSKFLFCIISFKIWQNGSRVLFFDTTRNIGTRNMSACMRNVFRSWSLVQKFLDNASLWIFPELQINDILLPLNLDYVKSGVFGVALSRQCPWSWPKTPNLWKRQCMNNIKNN